MAVMDNSLLRDLFQNNIDFTAKQISRILDALYGEQSDDTKPLPDNAFIYHTDMYVGCQGTLIDSSAGADNQYSLYSVDINNDGVSIRCSGSIPASYNSRTTSAQLNAIQNNVLPYLENYSYTYSLEELNIDTFVQRGNIIYGFKDGNTVNNLGISQSFGISNVNSTIARFQTFYNDDQKMTVDTTGGYNAISVYRYQNLRDPQIWGLRTIDDDYYHTNYILYPNGDSNNVTQNDTSLNQTIVNYNGDTIYNYYSDDGSIVINGGGVGIAPIGGLGYADVKFILDSLIDDLNVEFDFGADGVTEPLNYAPTWEELHYIDQGSFYITPIKQIDSLPIAPDIADTVIDVSEPLDILSYGFGALLSAFDSLGVTLTLTFTFLACLVINKLRGD